MMESIKMAWLQVAGPADGPPSVGRPGGKPFPYVELYIIAAVVIVRTVSAAAPSFAAIFAFRRLEDLSVTRNLLDSKKKWGRSCSSSPLGTDSDYWSGVKAWHAVSVAAAIKPVGLKRTTPDSSEQNAR
jgi:hypothetical protein